MNILPFEENDLKELDRLRPEGWGDILPPHVFYLSNSFCFPKKILLNGTIAGIGTAIVFQNSGWLAHIIVSPKFRNQGIGKTIVEHLLDLLVHKYRCQTVSLISTDLGFSIYQKAGFKIQNEYSFFGKTAMEEQRRILNEKQNIKHFSEEYRISLLELDNKISGEKRSEIFNNKLESAFISIEDDALTGYFIPGLGEGLIASNTISSGLALLSKKIETSSSVVLPSENLEGINFLLKHGFSESNKAKRMIFGTAFQWEPKNLYSRIGGYMG